MKPKSKVDLSDPDIKAVLSGMKRAAQKARKLSEATGTPFYVWQDGKIVDLNPQPKRKTTPKKRGAKR